MASPKALALDEEPKKAGNGWKYLRSLPETHIFGLENRPGPKRKLVFQPPFLGGLC